MFSYQPNWFHCLFNQILNSKFSTVVSHSTPLPLCFLPSRPSLNQIKQTHGRIIASGLACNVRFIDHLLAFLALSSSTPIHYSLSVYQSVNYPTVFATNNMIRCFAKSEHPCQSLILYSSMLREFTKPNRHTFTFVLHACSKALAAQEGAQIHNHIVKYGYVEDVFIRNALINFYSSCCGVGFSRQVFYENVHSRDLVTWNTMLAALVRDGQIDAAEKMFAEISERDVISWSTMITGYVQNGKLEEGLHCFNEMRDKGLLANEAILVSVLSATAQLGLLEHGKLVHSLVDLLNLPMTAALGTTLIDMYAKCGCIEQSKLLFNKMTLKDTWTWNVMICGLASHGLGKEALELFEAFISKGFYPVNVTFIGVLNACSRAGMVSEGRHYFKIMMEDYKIKPEMEHYGCMVDLLGRAGFVDEATKLIEEMQAPTDPVLWATLLGACKIHGLIELGEKIGNRLLQLDPSHDGHYVQLASVYAKARKWEDVIRVRRLMLDRNTNKAAGWSVIEVRGGVHRFVAGDKTHESYADIKKMLEKIGALIAEEGYSPNVSSVLHDIADEEKEMVIQEHSERLAIAYGLLVSEVGGCIRIVKNLRVCVDCHDATKIISKIFGREIILRDGSRFHHFKDGHCSCDDFW